MKYTLLDMTQTILSSMDSDEVNSISDNVEATQVATIVRTAYYDLIDRLNLPEHYSLITLDASGDSTKPVLMTVPSTVQYVRWVKYNCATDEDPEMLMQDMRFIPLEDYLRMSFQLDIDEDYVDSFTHTVGSDTFVINYTNDHAPTYYTTFDDNTILFDSYDSEVDSTLQKSKTLACARLYVPFEMEDTFTPDLDDSQFTLLLNEAKSLAWLEMKQSQHPKAEQNARRGWVRSQKGKYSLEGLTDFDRLPNFGRRYNGRSTQKFNWS